MITTWEIHMWLLLLWRVTRVDVEFSDGVPVRHFRTPGRRFWRFGDALEYAERQADRPGGHT